MFEQWLENIFTHSLLLSPLMGVVFAAIFSGLTKAPDSQIPTTIIKTKEVYRERIIYRDKRQNNAKGGEDGIAFFIVIAVIALAWQYALRAEQIQSYLTLGLLCVFGFIITTTVVSFIKGHFTSNEWWLYIFVPLFFLSLSFYLLGEVKDRYDPQISVLAHKDTLYEFFMKSLTEYGRWFLITHVLGVLTLSILIFITSLIAIHYLSLMNQRIAGKMQVFWTFIVRITRFVSGKKGMASGIIFGILSFLLINQYVVDWIMKRS